MFQLLLIIIYLSFISLGLPDALLGAAWPSRFLRGSHFYDYFRWNYHFQPSK